MRPKLDASSQHILDDGDEDDRDNHPPHKTNQKLNKERRKAPNRSDIPICTDKRYERPKLPILEEGVAPTLHSETYKFRGMSQKQEVLLAVMDAQLNELKEEEEVLPDLRAKWVENAADILTGAPPTLPPLREVNHKIPLIDENKQYNYHLPRCPDSLKPELTEKI